MKVAVLYVHPTTKAVALTSLTHLVTPDLAPRKPFGDFIKGSIIEEARVFKVDTYRGVYFKVTDQLLAFSYVSYCLISIVHVVQTCIIECVFIKANHWINK